MKKSKRLLALLLASLMTVSCISLPASADEIYSYPAAQTADTPDTQDTPDIIDAKPETADTPDTADTDNDTPEVIETPDVVDTPDIITDSDTETDNSSDTDEPADTDSTPAAHEEDKTPIVTSGQCGENVYYELHKSGTLYIFGSGDMYDFEVDEPATCDHAAPSLTKNPWMSFPVMNAIIEQGVTNIGEEAFKEFKQLESAVISDSVLSIEYGAFDNCSALISIKLSDNLRTIKNDAFRNCVKLEKIDLPETVKEIGLFVFDNCAGLKEINVSERNEVYSSFDSILYNKDRTTLMLCPAAKEHCTIADNVKAIESNAFTGCKYLTEIRLPESLEKIGSFAFTDCTNITSMFIPRNVSLIEQFAFSRCTSLAVIDVSPDNEKYSTSDAMLLNKEKTQLIYCPNGKTNAIIPKSVTSLADYSFGDCLKIEEIIIPDNISSIPYSCFLRCKNLRAIQLPSDLETIKYYAFDQCNSLTDVFFTGSQDKWNSIDIGDSGNEALLNANIHYNKTLTGFDTDPDCDYLYEENEDGTLCLTNYSGSDEIVNIPEEYNGKQITLIAYNAFDRKRSIREITIPKTIQGFRLKSSSYYDDDPNSCYVVSAISSPFAECENLKCINVSPDNEIFQAIDGVLYTTVKYAGAAGDNDLDKLILVCYPSDKDGYEFVVPENVKYIGPYFLEQNNELIESLRGAFFNVKRLKKIFVHEHVEGIFKYDFFITYAVIQGYENTPIYNYSARRLLMFETIGTLDPDKKFDFKYRFVEFEYMQLMITEYVGSDTEVVIPETINGIEVGGISNRAFQDNSFVKKISIPSKLEYIEGVNTLCDFIYDMDRGNDEGYQYQIDNPGYAIIYSQRIPMFVNCENLEEIVVDEKNPRFKSQDGVLFGENIDSDHWTLIQYPQNKPGDTYVVPDFVRTIGSEKNLWGMGYEIQPYQAAAFSNCKNLTNLYIYRNVEEIIEEPFYLNIPVLYVYFASEAYYYALDNNYPFVIITEEYHDTDSDTESDTEFNTETETDTQSDTETDTYTQSDTETETDTQSDTETDTDTQSDTETDTDTQSDTETDTDTQSDTDNEPDLYGDVNGDGKVTAKDSMTVQRYAIKLAELTDEQLIAADVDKDGKVTAKDALYILRCSINLAVLPIVS
ncbi:MAG: leucine-rich repeat protein [Clostridia bacterium]|nr:leucine-rich repeat protein [Clostridia bacterium]